MNISVTIDGTNANAQFSSSLSVKLVGYVPDEYVDIPKGEEVLIKVEADKLSPEEQAMYDRVTDRGIALIPGVIV